MQVEALHLFRYKGSKSSKLEERITIARFVLRCFNACHKRLEASIALWPWQLAWALRHGDFLGGPNSFRPTFHV